MVAGWGGAGHTDNAHQARETRLDQARPGQARDQHLHILGENNWQSEKQLSGTALALGKLCSGERDC